MKPVTQITDRAKRYRANRVHKLRKRCEECGAKRNLGVGHRDGDESNNRPSNLFTQCKSCNGKQAARDKKMGRGVRTRQYNPDDYRVQEFYPGRYKVYTGAGVSPTLTSKKKVAAWIAWHKQIVAKVAKKNPGATNLAQYVQAAVEHTRGAHDEGGRVLHETPKSKRKEFAREIAWRKGYRSNPSKSIVTMSEADRLYKKFHGVKPDNHLSLKVPELDPYGSHPELAQFGLLVRLVVGEGVEVKLHANDPDEIIQVEDYGWSVELDFVPSVSEYRKMEHAVRTQDDVNQLKSWLRRHGTPDVAGEPNARQIYLVGGRYDAEKYLPLIGADPQKEIIDFGFCYVIEYYTQKRFDRMLPTNYYHLFGERTGVPPRLIYWRKAKLLQLVGGEYKVTERGIEN